MKKKQADGAQNEKLGVKRRGSAVDKSLSPMDPRLCASVPESEKVAIKILKKQKVLDSKQGLEFLLNEIRVHWALE